MSHRLSCHLLHFGFCQLRCLYCNKSRTTCIECIRRSRLVIAHVIMRLRGRGEMVLCYAYAPKLYILTSNTCLLVQHLRPRERGRNDDNGPLLRLVPTKGDSPKIPRAANSTYTVTPRFDRSDYIFT